MLDYPICDMHCDTAMKIMAGHSLTDPVCQVNLNDMETAGIGIQIFAVFVPPEVPRGHHAQMAFSMLEALQKELDKHPDRIELALNTADIERIMAKGKIAAILAIENGDTLEDNPALLERFYNAGIRLLTLVHSRSNSWITSELDLNPKVNGLNTLGREIVAEMNRLGMIIDLSHAHDIAVEKAVTSSSKPVIASHSNTDILCPVSRNLKDKHIRLIADSGGIIGVNFAPPFIDPNYLKLALNRLPDLFTQMEAETEKAGISAEAHVAAFYQFAGAWTERMADVKVSAGLLLRHIAHLIETGGIGCVGFGSDYDGLLDTPAELETCMGFNVLRQLLIEEGYTRQEQEQIGYRNFLRVFKEVCG